MLVDAGNVFASPYAWSGRRGKKREAFLARAYKSWGYQAVALGWGDFKTLQDCVGTDLPWVSSNSKPMFWIQRCLLIHRWKGR